MKIAFQTKNNRILSLSPARIIMLSFIILIFIGTLLLSLPIASNYGISAGFMTALFTATSASCVSGLVVVDTAKQWSIFGQIVILFLIQAGGLGIVTLATFFSAMLGRKVSLRGMILARESISHFNFEGIIRLIKKIVIITLAIEMIGALLLSISFVPKFGIKGFYYGIFHSVSAFCNSGFSINGNYKSFMEYNNDPIVIFTITGLIIIGGLGFTVWKDIYEYKKNKALHLHTSLVIIITIYLILFGTVSFLIFEYNNPLTMGHMPFFEKLGAAFFHSVSSRTGGFYSIPLNSMHEISKMTTILLMFIGAAPGSTAGGIKVTTFGVILTAIISQIKGSDETIILKRRVPYNVINKSLSIIGLSLALVVVVTTALLAFESGPNITFINCLYEAVSAFGTVGLSAIGTAQLSTIGKVFLIITMFLGRVGTFTFAISLSLRTKKNTDVIYPEGKIVVG